MRDNQTGMEGLSHAVPSKIAYHSVTETLRVGADYPPNNVYFPPRLHGFNPTHHGVIGAFYQQLRFFIDLTHAKHGAGIPVYSVFIGGDIHVDNIAFLQRLIVRDPVTNNFVYRGTQGFRETHIV